MDSQCDTTPLLARRAMIGTVSRLAAGHRRFTSAIVTTGHSGKLRCAMEVRPAASHHLNYNAGFIGQRMTFVDENGDSTSAAPWVE
jgi:hypothetical protein